jgi:sensor domain CHASE-containing protein
MNALCMHLLFSLLKINKNKNIKNVSLQQVVINLRQPLKQDLKKKIQAVVKLIEQWENFKHILATL